MAVTTLLACVVSYPLSAQDGPFMIAFALALYTTAAEGRFAAAVALAPSRCSRPCRPAARTPR
ncbi:hypothetical protein ACH4ZU_38235 [Streptomyces sp. NPDC020472]|uniref:hypothetical protein n=1 Tax=Streptomyces sp. NPDC020472 TaxID=3365075 RepID=UPI0037AA4BBC